MNSTDDDRTPSRIDRTLGWLIALGGCIVILDQTVFRLSGLGEWAPWWNAGALAVVAGIVGLAIGGLLLPGRVLVAAWRALPILYAVVQASWVWGYRGPDRDAAVPWLWTVEPAVVTIVLLSVRPLAAILTSLAISSTPALMSLIVLGTIPAGVARETPNQLGNLLYVVIFIGVHGRLQRLRALEREVQSRQRRQIRSAIVAEQQAKLARVVHDDVLSALSAAMQSTGTPSDALRRACGRALTALHESTGVEVAADDLIAVREAAAIMVGDLRAIDDGVVLDTSLADGAVRRDVTIAVTLAAAEALRNSLRHAGELSVRRVHLALSPERVSVTVGDDGVGFDPAGMRPGLGIPDSIERRMQEIGGSGAVRSQPSRGTEVILSWPT